VLDAAEKLRADPDGGDVAFLMLGDGAEKNNLVARAKQRGLDNVVFVDTVAKAEVARYWSLLDAAIVHLKKADLFAGVIPSKLFEAMAMGLPVLHGVEGESAEIVSENQAGLLFEPENAGALADSVMRLSRDRVLRDELGRNGARAVLKYGRPELAAQMLGVLESVSSAGTRH
jgi:glycosyltransferase involved in cell wall biosynthesis